MDPGVYEQYTRALFFDQLAEDPELASFLGLPANANPRARANGTLKVGDSGSSVRTLQEQLVALGYSLTITGTYDAQTEYAVKAFQNNSSLPATGQADKATRDAIQKDYTAGTGKSSGGVSSVVSGVTSFATGFMGSMSKPAPAAPVSTVAAAPVSTGPNWWLIGGVGVGVVLLGGIAVLTFRR